jgi:predicted nucleotide-binding protein
MPMPEIGEELLEVSDRLNAQASKERDSQIAETIARVTKAIERIDKSSSGSWLGYQSRVYYKDFRPPPPGAHFSLEWGLMDSYSSGSTGEWIEYPEDTVLALVYGDAGNIDLPALEAAETQAREICDREKSAAQVLLAAAMAGRTDGFLTKLSADISEVSALTEAQMSQRLSPGRVMSRDSTAVGQGLWVPPHTRIKIRIIAAQQAFAACRQLSGFVRKAASYLIRVQKREIRSQLIGTNVFIGHGHSNDWKDLRDFLRDRLGLPWDEFNRVPVAGITNIARLSEMLDAAAIALLVMTAEDEQRDGKLNARMNVIHEAGLFQGRLGFTRAIVLLEDGCEEFSNIKGLGQIRFPKGNIKAAFEDIRLVLEREGLIGQPDQPASGT